jgi:quinol monooxygenase YgiN
MSYTLDDAAYCLEYFYAKSGYREELIAALLKLVLLTRAESGCLQYDLLLDKESPDLIIMVVKFVDQKSLKEHERQPYVKDFAEKEMSLYCEKLVWNYAREIK